MTTLPTGETLPDYDDGPADGVDIHGMRDWLRQRFPDRWGAPEHLDSANRALVEAGHRRFISQVIEALQAVGDATLVKNATYRAMRKEGADIERLAARLANNGLSDVIIEHGGPVGAVLAILDNLDIATPAPAGTAD